MRKITTDKIFTALALLAFLAARTYAGQEQERAYIEWKPIEGALSYTVEIADLYDDIILEKTTEATKLEVSLPYGKYKYRVGMLTKFNKVSGWSEWHTLMIVPALEPKIVSATPAALHPWSGNRVTIKGKNLYRTTEVVVKNADSELPVKNVRFIDPETLAATVDASGAGAGARYDLVLKNPGDLLDLETVLPRHFTILEKPEGFPIRYYAGMDLGYFTSDLGMDDPYSGSLGMRFFYEFRSMGNSHPALSFLNRAPGLYPGLLLSVSGFLNPRSGFGNSSMIEAGFYLGYEFSFPLKGELRWHVSPVLGFKEYFRWHTYTLNFLVSGDDYFGTRPVLFTGANVNFDLPMKFYIGIGLEYNAVFDNIPAHLLGVFIRCGYRL